MQRLVLFLTLTIAISAPFWWMIRRHDAGIYTALLMWSPAVAGAIALKLTRGQLTGTGWRNADARIVFAAWLVTLGSLVVVHIPIFAAGIVHFPDAHAVADRARSLGIPGAPAFVVIVVYTLVLATSQLVRLAGPALGEELGWRGVLVPAACRRFGFAIGALLTGIVWAAWHIPLMIGRVSAAGFANFVIGIAGIGVAYAWFRLRADSVWPTTVMHALHNALIPSLFVKLSTPGPAADTWIDETGYAIAALGVLLAIAFIAVNRRWPAVAPESPQ